MNYKLVALDCDGTLLSSEGCVSKENIKIIRKLSEKGIKFIIATGRNDILVKNYIKEIGFNIPVIGCNGATVRDFSNNKLLNEFTIDKEILKILFNYFNENNILPYIFTTSKAFSNDTDLKESGSHPSLYGRNEPRTEEFLYIYEKNINSLIDTEKIIKIVIFNQNPELLASLREKFKSYKELEVFLSAKTCLDLVATNVSKGVALENYAKSIGISLNEIVSFGDSENDISMLSTTGYSFAMANGSDHAKKTAKSVTTSNNEDGVAEGLKKIFKDFL